MGRLAMNNEFWSTAWRAFLTVVAIYCLLLCIAVVGVLLGR
jgi:ABC-type multidrug transport system permease subunit